MTREKQNGVHAAIVKLGLRKRLSSRGEKSMSCRHLNRRGLRICMAAVLGCAFAVPSPARQADTVSVPSANSAESATNATTSPQITLNDLAWLQGQWSGTWGPRLATQTWSMPRAGTMLGTLQIIENDKTLVVEFVTISETPAGIEYRLLHFTPSLEAWEKAGPAMLALMSMDTKKIVFQNQSDGEPQQIVLTRTDPDTYVDHSEILPEDGDPQSTEITFHRQKPNAGNAAHR
jgi:hypothetical protein